MLKKAGGQRALGVMTLGFIAELETARLVERTQRRLSQGGEVANILGGLVKRLRELEPEFRQVEGARRTVSQPGRNRSAGKRKPD